jgi:hypothetical protein
MLHLYVPPSLRHFEPRWVGPLEWTAHFALEYDLAHAIRPRLVVDLGAGDCVSYFAYCQAIKDHDIDGFCYAFDDWERYQGEGAPKFNDVNAHGRQLYMGIAYFVRMPPPEAIRHFSPGTIDLLRIGPSAAVPSDALPEWASRCSGRGAVIVHGIGNGGGDAWQSLQGSGMSTFVHGDLGIALGASAGRAAPLLDLMQKPDEHDSLKRFYDHVAQHHRLRQSTDSGAYAIKRKGSRA